MERFKFSIIIPPEDKIVKLDELLIKLIGVNPLRVDDSLIQADNKDQVDFHKINSQIAASINPSLFQATDTHHFIEAARDHASELIEVQRLFEERKFENKRNKSIPMMYLFSQPLVERILI